MPHMAVTRLLRAGVAAVSGHGPAPARSGRAGLSDLMDVSDLIADLFYGMSGFPPAAPPRYVELDVAGTHSEQQRRR